MVRVQQKSTRQNHRYEPEQPAFPAQWCYGLYVLSPVRPGFVVTVASRHLAKRSTCIGAPGPHDFAVRRITSRLAQKRSAPQRPSHPTSNVRDDRETPLL
jgi:hypothetical protein